MRWMGRAEGTRQILSANPFRAVKGEAVSQHVDDLSMPLGGSRLQFALQHFVRLETIGDRKSWGGTIKVDSGH